MLGDNIQFQLVNGKTPKPQLFFWKSPLQFLKRGSFSFNPTSQLVNLFTPASFRSKMSDMAFFNWIRKMSNTRFPTNYFGMLNWLGQKHIWKKNKNKKKKYLCSFSFFFATICFGMLNWLDQKNIWKKQMNNKNKTKISMLLFLLFFNKMFRPKTYLCSGTFPFRWLKEAAFYLLWEYQFNHYNGENTINYHILIIVLFEQSVSSPELFPTLAFFLKASLIALVHESCGDNSKSLSEYTFAWHWAEPGAVRYSQVQSRVWRYPKC